MKKTFNEIMGEARKDIQAVEYWVKNENDLGDIKIRYADGSDDFMYEESRQAAENIANCAGVCLDVFKE